MADPISLWLMGGKMMYDASKNNPGADLGQQDGEYSNELNPYQKRTLSGKYSAEDEAYYKATGIDRARGAYGTPETGVAHDKYGRAFRSDLDSWYGAQSKKLGITPVEYGETSTFGGVNVGPAVRLNRKEELATKAKLNALGDQLWATAKGEGPSIAGMQMQANTEQALAANRAAAAGVGRMNAGLAMRTLGQQQSQALSSAAMGSAALKMQEAQAAQQAYGGLMSNMRAQDFAAAAKQADYQHATDLAQAGFSQQAQLASMDALNRAVAARAQLGIQNNQLGLSQRGMDTADAQWWFGQRFAANQADREAAMRAWAMGKGQGNIDRDFGWRADQAEMQRKAAQQAAMAQGFGAVAGYLGSSNNQQSAPGTDFGSRAAAMGY